MSYIAIGPLLILLVQVPVSIVLILGGRAMMTGRSYGLAMTAAILALVPCTPLWLFSLPMGIWAVWTLTRPDVRAAFGRPSARAGLGRGVFIVLAVLGGLVVVAVLVLGMLALSWRTVRMEASSGQSRGFTEAKRAGPTPDRTKSESPPKIVRQPWRSLEAQRCRVVAPPTWSPKGVKPLRGFLLASGGADRTVKLWRLR